MNQDIDDRLAPIHPGEILGEEFLMPMGLSVSRLAEHTALSLETIDDILNARQGITADTALRLARYFDTSEAFWMNLQSRYELEITRDQLGNRLDREVQKM